MKILNRAKSHYLDKYVIGQWLEIENQCFIIGDNSEVDIVEDGCFDDGQLDGTIKMQDFIYEVDKDTRSINFEDMIDSENNPIFASLSEDEKGGDIIEGDFSTEDFAFTMKKYVLYKYNFKVCKVIGIQK